MFQKIRPVPLHTTDLLRREIEQGILPAAQSVNIEAFGDAIYRYGTLAGECFADWQEGVFASKISAEIAKFVRELGILGVGQTSWGPTLFALARDHDQATWLQQEIAGRFTTTQIAFEISSVDNRGAQVNESARIKGPTGRR